MKTAAVDYDGTLLTDVGFPQHGEPVRGAKQGIDLLKRHGYKVIVHSCRTNPRDPETGVARLDQNGVAAAARDMYLRLRSYGFQIDEVYTGYGKPYAALYIDDKGVGWGGWEAASLQIIATEKGIKFRPDFVECFCTNYRRLLSSTQTSIIEEGRKLLSERTSTERASNGLASAAQKFREAIQSLDSAPVADPWVLQDLESEGGGKILSADAQESVASLLSAASLEIENAKRSMPSTDLSGFASSLIEIAKSIKDGLSNSSNQGDSK